MHFKIFKITWWLLLLHQLLYNTYDVSICTCMWCGDAGDYKDIVVFLISDIFVYTTDATNLYHTRKILLFNLQIMIQYCLY